MKEIGDKVRWVSISGKEREGHIIAIKQRPEQNADMYYLYEVKNQYGDVWFVSESDIVKESK